MSTSVELCPYGPNLPSSKLLDASNVDELATSSDLGALSSDLPPRGLIVSEQPNTSHRIASASVGAARRTFTTRILIFSSAPLPVPKLWSAHRACVMPASEPRAEFRV